MKIQLRKPFFPPESITKIENQLHKVLKSGKLTLGSNVKSLESNFGRYLGKKYAVGVSSATAGLHISLLGIGISKGDEVIVPAKTFISTANAAVYCNAKPIFCDVDNKTFQIDPQKIEKLITKKTKAIMPVHLAGNVCEMDEIKEISEKHNLAIIEDSAHAHGATYKRKKAGTFDKIGVFSFYPDKIMASSDGGMIVTDDYEIYQKLLLLRNVGRSEIGKYDFSIIGYNYRMNEIQAIIAKEQLRILPMMLKKRKTLAKIYDENLEKISNLEPQKISQNVKSSYYAYVLKLTKGNLSKYRENLKNYGIETSPMFTTLYKTKPYSKLSSKYNKICNISEVLDNQTFTIPLHPGLSEKDVSYVCKTIKQLKS
jgi:dTDP-4-amino-4,6-dideoxygalactose transaminase